MTSVIVTTLGNIRLTASYVDLGRGDEPTVAFHDEDQNLVASCPASALLTRARTVALRADEMAWDLGPIDVARINHLRRGAKGQLELDGDRPAGSRHR